MTAEPRIGLIAGEASGDALGADLMEDIRELAPHAHFVGAGGPRMRAAGLECVVPSETLAVNGFVEPVLALPRLIRAWRALDRAFSARPPDVLVGIDFNGFNLRFERGQKRRGMPVVHYVSPSVYAWRRGRLQRLYESMDRVLTLFPFEATFYEGHPVHAVFVGHPVARSFDPPDRAAARSALGLPTAGEHVLTLMPGSRPGELERHGRLFLRAARAYLARHVRPRVLVPLVDTASAERFRAMACEFPDLRVDVAVDASRTMIAAADVVLCKAGTSTLEVMAAGRPMVVAYRMGLLSAVIVRALLRTPWVALPNLLAGRMFVPEMLQNDATPEALARQLGVEAARGAEVERELRALTQSLIPDDRLAGARAVLEMIRP